MINLNFIIKQYIDKLTVEDIIELCKGKNIKISEIDAEIVLETAKKHWIDFYKGDPTPIMNKLKDQLDTSTYNKLLKVYLEYKNKGIIN